MLRSKTSTISATIRVQSIRSSGYYRRLLNTQTESSTASIADPTGYCRELVKKYDYEAFLVSQFYPNDMKGGYFALKAFSVRRVTFSLIGFTKIFRTG